MKKRRAPVSASNTPANHFGGSFGPNEWLVDEMYERYQQDPTSVDKAWWDFFADYTPPAQTTNGSAPKAGTKIVNVHPDNPKSNLPTVGAVIVLNDAETGSPVALMDGTYITGMRTGAAGAVAGSGWASSRAA